MTRDVRDAFVQAAEAEQRAARSLSRALVSSEDVLTMRREIDRAHWDRPGIGRADIIELEERQAAVHRFLRGTSEQVAVAESAQSQARSLVDVAVTSRDGNLREQVAPGEIHAVLLAAHARLRTLLDDSNGVWQTAARTLREPSRVRDARNGEFEAFLHSRDRDIIDAFASASDALMQAQQCIGESEVLATQVGEALANMFNTLGKSSPARSADDGRGL